MVYYDREQTINYLISKNIKPSLQRIAIMQYMMNHRVHPTVDEVYQTIVVTCNQAIGAKERANKN